MKTFVIGDIHGAGEELKGLLDKMSPSASDRVLFVGDAFDRGLHSPLVWELMKGHKTFMGNHEYKTMHWLQGRRDWLPKQYYVALNLLIEHGVAPNELLAWHEGLPFMESTDSWLVTHGGVVIDSPDTPDLSMNVFYSQNRNIYFADVGRERVGNEPKMAKPDAGDGNVYWWDLYQGDKLVIYGHLVTGDNLPRIRRNATGRINSIGLDTAAVHGGPLTGFCIEDFAFYSYRSGKDWGKQCEEQMKATPPVVHPELVKFVNEKREALKAVSGTVKVLDPGENKLVAQ